MKLTQLSVILGVLLLQVLIVSGQDDSMNPAHDENSDGNLEEHMLNDEAQSSPQETATRTVKLGDAETTFPPLLRPSETPEKVEKKLDGITVALPAPSENATKAEGDGGGCNNLYQNVALVFCVASFLYYV